MERGTETRRILIATDLTGRSSDALAHGIAMARRAGADLHLAHVTPVMPASLPQSASLQADVDALAHERLAELVAESGYAGAGLHVRSDPHPGTVLVRLASELRADVIVVGIHSRAEAMWPSLGSVSTQVVRDAPMNVMVVGPDTRASDADAGYRRILVAVDFSDASVKALHAAARIAEGYRSELTALHVIEPVLTPPYRAGPNARYLADTRELRRDANRTLAELVLAEKLGGRHVELLVGVGSAAESIVEAAAAQRSDLLVIGADGLGGPQARSGSTTGLVLTSSPCPVLVVRSEPPGAGAR